ncbi:tetraacyldisaccharide 4'-kinase [Marinicella gelatinilytica]|uniref:tetraacyldisaccharide 4'-kinase n=1 Tax=Marinicella gelatinilytica TaxID=2996017 RepID=UPI002260A4B1|nr:tetraacyldisaccharide 4'-kinase [Marinicella gelatinilytica]MCX7544748.1 tetraacyldisaccharide 4'-kinase [Marinicella gelatinilytica]
MKHKEEQWNQRWYSHRTPAVYYRFLAAIFASLSGFRRWLYRLKILKTHEFKVPVIVVGNITVGGGGKTPMVIYLAELLKAKGLRVGIVSRGYGGKRKVEPMLVTPGADPAASGDEPLLMAKTLNIPVMVAKSRSQAVKTLISQHHVNVVLSDDGLQHYAMARDAEIVMLDADRQLGNERLIPAGPLREKPERLKQVDLVIYKDEVADGLFYQHQIDCIYQLNRPKTTRSIESLRSQKIIAMAGIANPEGFFKMLSGQGLAVVKQPKADHHVFIDADFSDQYKTLITEKDAVKCSLINHPDVWVVKTTIKPSAKTADAINALLNRVLL